MLFFPDYLPRMKKLKCLEKEEPRELKNSQPTMSHVNYWKTETMKVGLR